MTRRRRQVWDGSLSLVPMADMLTNTVGIMLFIMAFTILASAGAVVLRTLPKETASGQSPVLFVCLGQRVLPLDRAAARHLTADLPKPTFTTLSNWVERFNAARYEDDHFVVTGRGRAVYDMLGSAARLHLTAIFTAKAGAGDDAKTLELRTSNFARVLEKHAGGDKFAYFIVYPDSIDVFREARKIAATDFRMRSGWSPQGSGTPISVSLAGGGKEGISPEPQSTP